MSNKCVSSKLNNFAMLLAGGWNVGALHDVSG